MKTATIHGQDYEFYPWDSLGDDVFSLAQQILEDSHEFDRIIALAKGGLTFARSMVDFLAVEAVSSIQIEFYTAPTKTQELPVITQSLPVSIKNEKVLIFDDIVDSGETLRLATEYLGHHGAQSVTTAVLIAKPWTKFNVDYFARKSEAWVIFPNEVRETIEALTKQWSEKGDSTDTIQAQLQEIGFTETEVALFSKLG